MERPVRVRTRISWLVLAAWLCGAGLVDTYDGGLVAARQVSANEQRENLRKLVYNTPKPKDPQNFDELARKREILTTTITPSPMTLAVTTSTALQERFSDTIPTSSSVKSMEDFYRIFYGSDEGARHLRRKPEEVRTTRANFKELKQGLDDVQRANEHFLRIWSRAKCKIPAATLIRVKDEHPDVSKEYIPRCTILHRCGKRSGCCENDAMECAPSSLEAVTLHFYSLGFNEKGIPDNRIVKLRFINHTACHCQSINELPRSLQSPRDEEHDKSNPLAGIAPADLDVAPPKIRHHRHMKCRDCPVPFTSRIYRDGRCGCDCFDRQKPCLKIKRGRDHLSEVERRCVVAAYCHIPECEYGIFNTSTGYCPQRHDKPPRNNRWTFGERD